MNRNIRDYEVSIWTLQDSFITILKHSNTENKGRIQEPDFKMKNDGTLTFTFSIPMYLYEGNEKKENPIWYNTRNGNLIADLRKIKVIFNKDTDEEAIFEFLITKVTEEHEGFKLFCYVETEGLAFHELGKIGYKLSLNENTYILEWNDWANSNTSAAEPRCNINYWCDKIFTNTNWSYEVQMDWSSSDGIITDYFDLSDAEKNNLNISRENSGLRRCDKIYEDAYAAAWNINNNTFIPTTVVPQKEKERLIDIEESNIYNITQSIAEAFGVHCKYEYVHDADYHIIKRKVIFYNNFLQESLGTIDINYSYNTNDISREMDATDTISKMYVKTLNDSNTESGLATITDVASNKSQEDYLLNFDYLYSIGTISQEQYDEVNKYEIRMHEFNEQLKLYEKQINALQDQLITATSQEAVAKNAISLDNERISANNNLLNSITNNTGIVHVTGSRPETGAAIEDNGSYYVNLRQKGIISSSLKLYTQYNAATGTLSNQVLSYTLEYDDANNLIKVKNLDATYFATSALVYLIYDYEPQLYYENIRKMWETRLYKDTNEYNIQHQLVENINNNLENLEAAYDTLLQEKLLVIKRFERLMGPALREGYWQPEDEYAKYGEKHKDQLTLNMSSTFSNQLASIGWDNELFEGENKNYYEIEITQTKEYYPCINLSNYLNSFVPYADNLSQVSFIYQDTAASESSNSDDLKYLRFLPIGAESQLCFIKLKNNVNVIPVLMLTGLETSTYNIFDIINYPYTHPRIGILTTDVIDGTVTSTITEIIPEIAVRNNLIALNSLSNYEMVYPRIQINSSDLKKSEDSLILKYNNTILNTYEDYYVLSRTDNQNNFKYYITIKPELIFKKGNYGIYTCLYELSNAGLFMYLDALQVLKENAYPRVSYEIKPTFVDDTFIHTAYKNLNRIVHLNDFELKFENVYGYITELQLKLDAPQDDTIIIDNYKTKFEDLFSTIVAQSEQMKKNSTLLGMAAQTFTNNGEFKTDMVQTVMNRVDLNYAFNNGTLTIDEEKGIWAVSDDGVVAFRGGGIFTATEKDDNDDWIWNTGILPSGINASLITTGQLDTNLIRIFAGNDLKFQLNGEGLYAYKSWWDDAAHHDGISDDNLRQINGLDLGQYVVHNSEGLFLIAENGTKYWDGTQYVQLNTDVERVAISWDGLTLRNWQNEKVFYADANTGNLTLDGTIYARELIIASETGNIDITDINSYISDVVNNDPILLQTLDDLQRQVDGEIDTWFYVGAPAPTTDGGRISTNLEQEWGITYVPGTGYSTDDLNIILRHNSDVYYDIGTPAADPSHLNPGESITAGQAFRFIAQKDNNDVIHYYWQTIADTATTAAIAAANMAQEIADSKIRTFIADEQNISGNLMPDVADTNFDLGDLWINNSRDKALYRYDGSTWILADNSISAVDVEYASGSSATQAPTTGWSTSSPTWSANQYIWSRTKTIKNGSNYYTEPVCIQAAAARSIILSGEQIFLNDVDAGTITPATITLTASVQNLNIGKWYYKNTNAVSGWTELVGNAQQSSYTFSPSTANIWNDNKAIIKVEDTTATYFDVMTVVIVGSGASGSSGYDASIAFLTNENIGFSANSEGLVSATTITCNIVSYTGITKVTPTINSSGITGGIANQLTITSGAVSNNEIPLTITVSNNVNLNNQSVGIISIPITSPVSTTLNINWTKINDGADGLGISSITEYYYLSTSNTAQTGGSWNTTPQNWSPNHYYWTKSIIIWEDSSTTETTPILAAGLNNANSLANSANTTANNAYTLAQNIQNGTSGIYFQNSSVGSVTLNNSVGLKIIGTDNSYFQVKNNAMGFFKNDGTAMLYYDNGNMVLAGGAHIGGINGWTIGNGSLYSGSASSLDAPNGIYLGTDGISITSGSAHFSTSDFKVDINDGMQQFSMDSTGAAMSSLSVDNLSVTNFAAASNLASIYNGPTQLYVNSNYTYDASHPERFSTLTAALDTLNNKTLSKTIQIIITSNITEQATLEGINGGGFVYIYMNNDWTLNGSLDIRGCGISVFLGYNSYGLNIHATSTSNYALRVWNCAFVQITNGTYQGASNSSSTCAIRVVNGAKVKLNSVTLMNAYYLLYVADNGDVDCFNISGDYNTYFVYGSGARITWAGTRPPGDVSISLNSLVYPENLSNLTIADIGGTVPVAPTGNTLSIAATATGTYGSGWVGSETKMYQGVYNTTRHSGCMWFNNSAYAGKTIDSASLTITRASTQNGSGRAINIYLYVISNTGKTGSNPRNNIVGSGYLVGTALRGETITISDSNLVSLIQTIANNGATYGLMIDPGETSVISGKSYSTNYGVFIGSEGSSEGLNPQLTVTYH